jgi:tetraacyldisaccharide 4'-kinase
LIFNVAIDCLLLIKNSESSGVFMFIFQYLLWPFAALYHLATAFRNYLYDTGHKKSFEFETFVISVGNLNVGGSGKTPMVEYLVRLLSDRYKVATLSRGYGRKTHGIRIATEHDNARSIGDEPFQLKRKYGDKIVVVVGEERALAIPTLLNESPDVQVIIMDDAFQHRAVKPQLSILVTDREKPFYKDYVLPMGRLRESRTGSKRADVIVVTKANGINEEEMQRMKDWIQHFSGYKPVFFSGLVFEDPVPIEHNDKPEKKVVLVSGIANNAQVYRETSRLFDVCQHFRFPDHHVYRKEEIENMHQWADHQGVDTFFTTEKDMVKLIAADLLPLLSAKKWFYLPVRAFFIENGMYFDDRVLRKAEENLQTQSS